MRTISSIIAGLCAGLALAACETAPFSYAEDRCLGGYNQCTTACTRAEDGPAHAACFDRCRAQEQRCLAHGADAAGGSMAEDDLIARARSQREKEEGYARWRAQKQRDEAADAITSEESGEDGNDVAGDPFPDE